VPGLASLLLLRAREPTVFEDAGLRIPSLDIIDGPCVQQRTIDWLDLECRSPNRQDVSFLNKGGAGSVAELWRFRLPLTVRRWNPLAIQVGSVQTFQINRVNDRKRDFEQAMVP
jgi:hypothetical protein